MAAVTPSGHHDDSRPASPTHRPALIYRHPLDWTDPALPAAARTILAARAAEGVADLGDVIVAVPGGRAGRRLKELLVEVAEARDLRLVPPRIVTIGDLVEQMYDPERPPASIAVRRLAWATTLRGAPAGHVERLFARRPAPDDLAGWMRLAAEVMRLHRDVARGGHDFGSVAGECGAAFRRGALGFDDTARWSALSALEGRYRAALETEDRADPDLERLRAVRTRDLEAPGPIWLVSIPEMSGVIRDALRAVSEQGAEVHLAIHAPEHMLDHFDDLGCVRAEAWEQAHLPLRSDQLLICDRPVDQADAVANVLAGLDGAKAADEIVIGVPDPELVSWIEERLGEAGVPVRDAAGRPVERTAPYRLLEAVAEVLDTRRYADVAALARHPDFGRWLSETTDVAALKVPGAWVPALDAWCARHAPARLPRAGQGIPGGDDVVSGFLAEVDGRLLGRDPEASDEGLASLGDTPPRPLGAWARPIVQLLTTVYGGRELQPAIPDDRTTLRALDAIADAAHELAHLPGALDIESSAASALRVVLEQVRGAAIPTPAEEAAVELLGWLELPLDDADVVVVTGVNEPRLPESVTSDAFLPDALRVTLGLVDNRRRYARDAYRLTAMLHTADERDDRRIVLISGRRKAAGDPLRPSRLLFATEGAEVAKRVLDFYAPGSSVSTASDGVTTGSGDVSGFVLPPESIIEPSEKVRSLRVTDFRALLASPYLFALERFRHCDVVDDVLREMDPLVFGTLLHRVLERVVADPEHRHSTDARRLAGALDAELDRQVGRRFGSDARWAHVAVRVQVEQARARLRRFAEWHAGWIAQGWRVAAVECGTDHHRVPLDVDGEPIELRARIDRVDHHPESGRWVVFDYKTSERGDDPESTHRRRDRTWTELQLPLYRYLVPRLRDERGELTFPDMDEDDVDVGYVLLPRDLDGVGDAIAGWDAADHADALEAARDVVRAIRTEGFPFDPDVRLSWPDPELEALLGRGRLVGIGADDEEGDT